MSIAPAVTLRDLTFEWPDGATAFTGLTGTFPTGRTGLVGRNGAGKSTLLRLVSGELRPSRGEVAASGTVGYLHQSVTLRTGASIADLLGIAPVLDAIRAVEHGDVDVRHFDTIGDDWDLESRAREALDRLGFEGVPLDRRVEALSGGETMLIAIEGMRVRRTAITLLDEPTNNLDREMRARVRDLLAGWPGSLVVVSHDVDLLETLDANAELSPTGLEFFGGPYSAWLAHRDREQAAAIATARSAQQALKVEKRQRVEAETKLARRERTGKRTQRDGGIPKILAGNRASKAQNAAGSMRATLDVKVAAAQEAVDRADARVRVEERISLVLPDPDVRSNRRIAEFEDGDRTILVQGPERVALVGPNGVGKSTLLARLLGHDGAGAGATPASSRIRTRLHTDRIGFLDQRQSGLDEAASALANVREAAPEVPDGTARNLLARLLIRGAAADRPVATLSGGERFRVALARLLFQDPPAQLLILDEPTNNLDTASIDHLAQSLDAYRGALIVVSHDDAFLGRLGIDLTLELGRDGGMRTVAGFAPTAPAARAPRAR
ncbi:ABC-F family ATP-binding cassette domain-containing protein [Leucobacter iarius]|uniref:ABC-F family ATP-binding cassette domain-containing protein n=1 Tax=Leucobacter iarius TaxID=333963 RepID=A0ABN2L9K6_9MICO